jgi:bla regulator protein blaR1
MMDSIGNHIWQSTLFAIAAAFLTLFFQKSHARIRYWLWLAASIKFLIPFSLFIAIGSSIDFSWRQSASVPQTAISYVDNFSQPFGSIRASTAVPEAAKLDRSYWIAIFLAVIWLCGFIAVLSCCLMKGWRLSVAVRRAPPVTSGRANEILRTLKLSAGFKVCVKPASSVSSIEPGVFGIFRPVLVMPDGIVERLKDSELEAIIAHEVVHVRHHDNLLATVHMAIEALFWFHPIVWWLGVRLVEERERACDEEVLKLGKDPRSYAEGILKVCEFYLESPLMCAAGVTGSVMKKRIQSIVKRHIGEKLTHAQKLCLAMAFFAALAVPVLLGLLNAPLSRAQSQTEAKLSFEVVSIKSAPNCDGSRPADLGPGRMVLPCVKLRGLIRGAYSDLFIGGKLNRNPSRLDVLGGPRWIDTDTFYVQAKTEAKASIEQMYGPMMRALLEERFQLKVHKEFRDKPVYELTVAKSNPNLRPTTEGSCIEPDPNDFSIPTKIGDFAKRCGVGTARKPNVITSGIVSSNDWRGLSMAGLAGIIARNVDRPVIDKTGLTGLFDFSLEFVPVRPNSGMTNLNGRDRPDFPEPSDDAAGPSIFSALKEQLGLKLSPANGSSEVIVIDRVEKPSPN